MLQEYLTLSEAAKHIPSRPSTQSLWRWCRRGLRTRDGGRAHLDHRRIGGQIYTTDEWLDEFFRETTDKDVAHFRNREQLNLRPVTDQSLSDPIEENHDGLPL